MLSSVFLCPGTLWHCLATQLSFPSQTSQRLTRVQGGLPHVTTKNCIPVTYTETQTHTKTLHIWPLSKHSPCHHNWKIFKSHLIPGERGSREKEGRKKRSKKEHTLNSDLLCTLGWQRSHMFLTHSVQVQLPPPSSPTAPPPPPIPRLLSRALPFRQQQGPPDFLFTSDP